MRRRFAKEAPPLSGEDIWSIRRSRLRDFSKVLDDAGVATTVDKGDD